MNKGFPKEVGTWDVHAKIPATRTSGASERTYSVEMIEQGTKIPDYNIETVDGEFNSTFIIHGNDIIDFYDEYENVDNRTTYAGYIIFNDVDIQRIYGVFIAKNLDEQDLEYYTLQADIDDIMEYQGDAKVHLLSAVNDNVSLHSADFTITGKWSTRE